MLCGDIYSKGHWLSLGGGFSSHCPPKWEEIPNVFQQAPVCILNISCSPQLRLCQLGCLCYITSNRRNWFVVTIILILLFSLLFITCVIAIASKRCWCCYKLSGPSTPLRPWCIFPLFQISPPISDKFSDSVENFQNVTFSWKQFRF